MKWGAAPLEVVAPARGSDRRFKPDELVWHLTLDQIEAHTGRVLEKIQRPFAEAGTSTFVFDNRNVLYSKLRPYLNKVVCPAEPGVATTELVPLRPDPRVLDRNFLAYYLRSPRFLAFASSTVAGVKMPRIIMGKLWEHEIPLPPLSEQRRIVEILDQADALRKKRAEADAKAARILPALFCKMFGDPATNPKGLTQARLGDVLRVRSGEFLPSRNMEMGGKIPVFGGNGINGYHTRALLDGPVVIIGRVGVYCGSVYYCESACWVTDNALYVAEHDERLHPRYLAEALRMANLNAYAGRAGQPLISGSRIYPVKILVPKWTQQLQFAKAAEEINRLHVILRAIDDSFDRLVMVSLHRAFSGELTARWREAHMKELLAEMEAQSKLLEAVR